MPGRVFLTDPITDVAADLGVDAGLVQDEPPRRNIAPGQNVVVLTSSGLTRMRWGLIPSGRVNARGRPVMETIINTRSETLFGKSAFKGVGRAVLPVNGWYEWTGKTRHKTAWRLRPADGGLLYFAAISDVWDGPGGVHVPQMATVTCDPNGDVRPIHHRMAVILSKATISKWLDGAPAEVAPLMAPWPDGKLVVEQADDVDWDGP